MVTTLRDLISLPLALGGDVFGWTADERATFAVLDAFTAAGGTQIDTADVYNAWAPGHVGGESEQLIGRWLRRRGRRDDVVIASKVSQHPELRGLAADTVRRACDASLARLGVDHIDLYYAHYDDPDVPVAEAVGALSSLVDAGKIRFLGASNYTASRLREWLAVTESDGLHPLAAFQPLYNLMERGFEDGLRSVVAEAGVEVLPFSALANGFLTGKYRDGVTADSGRTDGTSHYLDDRGRRVLAVLDRVAADHTTTPTAVAIAWLRDQPTVLAPISSVRSVEQLAGVLAGAALDLTAAELAALGEASATVTVPA